MTTPSGILVMADGRMADGGPHSCLAQLFLYLQGFIQSIKSRIIITDKKHHISKLHVEKLLYQIRTQTGIERFWYGFVQIDNSFPVSGPAIVNYIPS